MSTFIPGTDAIVQLDNASNTLIDISPDVSTTQFDVAYQIGTFYTIGTTGAQTSEGQRTFTGSIGIRATETDDPNSGHYLAINWLVPGSGNKANARSLRIQHPDAAAGSYQYDSEIRATAYPLVSVDAGGDGTPAMHNLQFNVDGDVTLSIIV